MGKKRNPTSSKSKVVDPPRRDPTLEIRSECMRSLIVFRRGSHTKALRLMRETLRKHGDSALVHRVNGDMHSFMSGVIENPTAKQKHINSARESLKRATELAPNSIEFAYFYALLLFDYKAENEGYELVLAECERALSLENPIDPAEEYLDISEMGVRSTAPRLLRISEVQENLEILVEKCNFASISTETETLNEEKYGLEHRVPTIPTAPPPGRNNEINKIPKTLDERRKEIEVRVAAASLLQLQHADPGQSPSTTSSGPHNEEEHSSAVAAASSSSSEELKNHLIPVCSSSEQVDYPVAKGPTAPLPRIYSVIKNAPKTFVEPCQEIEECVSALRLLQQQRADPNQPLSTTSSGPHNEEEHSSAAAATSSSSSEEEKNHLIPVHSSNEQVEYSVTKGPTAPLLHRYNVIIKDPKTYAELRKEIEIEIDECISAARLLQQQCLDPDQPSSTAFGPHSEDHSSAASSESPSPRYGFNKPVSHNLVNSSSASRMNQVRAYWNSMTAKRQLSFLRASIPEVKSHYAHIKDTAMIDLLSEALSFAAESGSLEFWICFKCNEKFSDAVSHLNHIRTHFGMMSDLAIEAIPEEVNSDLVGMLTNTSMKPIDVESVIRSSDEASNINSNLLKDTGSANSDYANPVDCLERERKENWDCNGFQKMECVVSGGDGAGGRLHKWPLSDDPERVKLLEKIQSIFGLMIKHRCLSTSHVRKLLEFGNNQIKSDPLPSNVLDACGEELERILLYLCFLDASMLQAVFCVLQELSHTGGLQKSAEKDLFIVNADGATKNGIDLETLKLDLKSSTLTIGGAEGERGLRDANAVFQWIYAGPSIADWLASWACSKEEKSNQALKLVQTLEKELSLFQILCERKLECLVTLHMLENLREEKDLGFEEFFNRKYDLINDVLSTVKDNLNAELNKMDVQIMRGVAGMHLLELKLGAASLFDYRFVLIPLIKSFVRTRLEELAEKDESDTSRPDAIRKAILAEVTKKEKKISWKGESKQSNEISKDKKKGRDYRISMSPKGSSMDPVIQEERAEKFEVALSDNMGGIRTDEVLNQDGEETKQKIEIEAKEGNLDEFLEYRRRLEKTLEYLEMEVKKQQQDLKNQYKPVIGIYRDDPWM